MPTTCTSIPAGSFRETATAGGRAADFTLEPGRAQPSRGEYNSFLSPAQAAGAPTFCNATESRQRTQPRGLSPPWLTPTVFWPALSESSALRPPPEALCAWALRPRDSASREKLRPRLAPFLRTMPSRRDGRPTPPPAEGRYFSLTLERPPLAPAEKQTPSALSSAHCRFGAERLSFASRRQRALRRKPQLSCAERHLAPPGWRRLAHSYGVQIPNWPTNFRAPGPKNCSAPLLRPTVSVRAPAKSCSNAYPAFERFRTLGAARGAARHANRACRWQTSSTALRGRRLTKAERTPAKHPTGAPDGRCLPAPGTGHSGAETY